MITADKTTRVASRREWLAEREALLKREKALTRESDAVAAARRDLPWVKIERTYVFDTLAGPKKLGELFEGRSQLFVYHFMFGPGWEEGCPSCSFAMDHIGGMLPHLNARNITFVAISRASLAEIEKFRQRMGWTFNWVSTADGEFAQDFGVSFTREEIGRGVTYNYQSIPPNALPVEELPGISVFATDPSCNVFHTYSSYARGCEALLGTYSLIDLTPRGRDEKGLAQSMSWLRHHDRYGADYQVDATSGYRPPRGSMFRPCCD